MPAKRHSTASQAGPSRRRRMSESEDSDEAPAATQASQGRKSVLGITKVRECAAKLVRLALFFEYQHRVIRRQDILQHVIPAAGKGSASTFSLVLETAQTMLRTKFGMELYELQKKPKAGATDDQAASQTQARSQTQRARRSNGRLDAIDEAEEDVGDDDGATQGGKHVRSNQWIVRSILSFDIRELLAIPQALPLFDEDEGRQAVNDDVDSGAVIPWDKADGTASGDVQMMGVRMIILCLVMCSGRVIADDHLHALLKRLNLERDTLLPYSSPDGKLAHLTLDKYLDILAAQQYLQKVNVAGQLHSAEAAKLEWRWGSRDAEFSEQTAAKWIVEIITGNEATEDEEEDDEEEEEEDDSQARRDRRKKQKESRTRKLKSLNADIIKAAGGPLGTN